MSQKISAKTTALIVVLALILLGAGYVIGWKFGYENKLGLFGASGTKSTADLSRAYNLIANNYYGEKNPTDLVGLSLSHLSEDLADPNSFYASAEDMAWYKKLQQPAIPPELERRDKCIYYKSNNEFWLVRREKL